MSRLKARTWAGALAVISSILLIATFPLYYPFVRTFVERLRNIGKTASDGLTLKEKFDLSLESELDKRLGGLFVVLYRLTGGRITLPWKVKVLILTTRGRKSGKKRNVLLQFFQDGKDIVVVAANGGKSTHPGWFYNLKATPIVRVQVMDRKFQVHAEEMTDDEAIVFWPSVLSVAPTYERYQGATKRIIPLVRLVPIEQIGESAVPGGQAQHGPEELSFTK